MDIALGEAIEKAGDDTVLMVMSDHGFAPYNKSFHLSSWLLDNGYVILADPTERDSEFLMNVEWFGTKAYSLGINGIYLNLEGREEDGIVQPNQADKILDEIIAKLLLVEDPETGAKVVSAVYKTSEVYSGPHKDEAPDLIVGYSRGYRASWETALGKFPKGDYLTINYDEWSGDHCMAADLVPGSLLTNRPVKLKDAMLYDLPVTILELFGIERPTDMIGRNVFTGK
jgi:predicted AlkP superfamily phosphohydrolase/phosphomutase